MREYKTRAVDEVEDGEVIIDLEELDTTESIRDEYYYHYDDSCYWAKEQAGEIYYSRDDVFSSERLDATHIIIFLK